MSRGPISHRLVALLGAIGLLVAAVSPAFAADPKPGTDPALVPDRPAWDTAASRSKADLTDTASGATRLLVRFRPGTSPAHRRATTALAGVARVADLPSSGLSVVRATNAIATMATLRADPAVLRVSVDHRRYRDADPTGETYYKELWGLDNTGQKLFLGSPGTQGLPDVDIDSRQAQGITTGDPNLVVAVIDDGVDFTHPDLADRAWTNPGESGGNKATNGIDDDGNGYIDDVHGWDFCHNDNTVHDPEDDFHGTHVAGTIAASLNGGGVVGVAPSIKVMALKFLGDPDGDADCGFDDQAIAAIQYAASFSVHIANTSWGGRGDPSSSPELYDAMRDAPILFLASAGNDAIDNDTNPFPALPASFDLPNIVSIAAVDNSGVMADFSNFGEESVDISAPGVAILSSIPTYHGHPQGWAWLDGTSMAAPHATGVVALIASYVPSIAADPLALRARLLATGKAMPATVGWTATGRIVDAYRALDTHGPLALAPTIASFVKGSVLGSSTATTKIAWPAAADDLTGISDYGVGLQIDGGAWTTFDASTTTRSAERALKSGHAYLFRVRARDGAHNWGAFVDGPLLRPTLYQESSTRLTFSKSWKSLKSSTASGGKTKSSSKKGATATFSFTGRAFALVAPKSSGRGQVKLYIDGVFRSTIDLHRSSGLARVLVATGSWATPGPHTVKLVVVGTHGHARVDVDGFVVLR